MSKSVIVSGARTPFGKYGGALKTVPAVQLGGIAIAEALRRANLSGDQVENVIMGMVLQGGAGQIPARQAARQAGLPWEVPAENINKVCASGLRSVGMADQMIRSGDYDIIVAGGMESMSNAPYMIPGARWGNRMGHSQMVDLMIHDGLTCAFHQVHMAVHGSNVAREYGVAREEQDHWALRSHQRAVQAIDEGKFKDEIVPVVIPQKRGGETMVDTDEGPRRDTSLEALAKLAPIFLEDGTVTAGNAPGVNDGAGAVVVMSESKSRDLGLNPLATIEGQVSVALEAPYISTAPAIAIKKLLDRKRLKVGDIDLFEVNEAFAAVVLTSGKIVNWDQERVNVNGGAVALGHPIGASGTRILLNLIYELRRRGGGLGIAAICSGAAQGDALLVRV